MSTHSPVQKDGPDFEPYVSADVAAKLMGINRRFLLSLARKGIAGSYAIGTGDFRKKWIFRMSELGVAIDHRHPRPFPANPRYDPDQGSPR
jgi:hypothetical protein